MPITQRDSRPRKPEPDEPPAEQNRRNSRADHRSRRQSGRQWIAAIGTGLTGVAAILALFVAQHKDTPTINYAPHIESNSGHGNIILDRVSVSNGNGTTNVNPVSGGNGNGTTNVNTLSVGNANGGNNLSHLTVAHSAARLRDSVPVTPAPAATLAVHPSNADPQPVAFRSPTADTPSRPSPPSDFEKYIDPRAPRQAGKKNVAISIEGIVGEELAPLEDAMRQGLIEGGNSVIPLFRDRFRIDGIGTRLFDGDPTLVSKLKLREHCDAVLLGSLRFVGPAQAVADGFYVREIVLDVHQIDPVSGQIDKSWQIREKGGGADAQLSTTNALSRLKDKIETSISEWT